jgi:ubiquinone/menaquinone biosynthesis C-methylase UbiE
MITTENLLKKFYKSNEHPYRIYEKKINSVLGTNDCILDAGCGREALVLKKIIRKGNTCIGIDLEKCIQAFDEIYYICCDISQIGLESNSVDIVISRAVLEHIVKPLAVYQEINRVLKKGGRFIFLVPNISDYTSILSLLIPNKYHSLIISKTEGRKPEDVFPTYYKSNSKRVIKKLAESSGFRVLEFKYLGQYPSTLQFNPTLFLLGTLYDKIISRFDSLRLLRAWILTDLQKV